MRIGTNHGSLSDRILSKFGDTPLGMVESALEYLRICEDHNYYNIVLSMKASNPLIMVHAYRLLVEKIEESDLKKYPLHLGVTEAGEGEDGRIKSAIGIGTLLDDGIGDTVRVSLTEEPEHESPIAKILVDRYINRTKHNFIRKPKKVHFSPFHYEKRESVEIKDIGGDFLPIVISDLSNLNNLSLKTLSSLGIEYNTLLKKWDRMDNSPDYLFLGDNSNNIQQLDYNIIYNYKTWIIHNSEKNCFPLIEFRDYIDGKNNFSEKLNFLKINTNQISELFESEIPNNFVLVLESSNIHSMPDMRSFFI